MAIADNRETIDRYLEVLKQFRRKSALWGDEEKILELCKVRYKLIWSQIHEWDADKGTEEAEREVRELIKSIRNFDLLTCEAKIKIFKNAIKKYSERGNNEVVEKCYRYLQEWLRLYEDDYAIVAYRSLEHYANFMEWEKRDKDKVWKYSIDPQGDKGYTGVNYPFFYYFNQMVLKKKIKFISKQQATGTGKCVIPTTEIATPNGIKKIKDINIGDDVYSMDNNELVIRKVTNKWNSNKKQIKITTKGGCSITVSPEHRMFSQKGYVQAKDLTTDDYMYRLCSKVHENNPVVISKDELIFVTCMLFDGHCKSNGYGFSKMPNTEITNAFCESCNNLGIKYTIYDKQNTECKTYRPWQNDFIVNKLMNKYELDGKLSKEKRLPKQFFNMSLENKYKFIGLMFATDGYFCKNKNSGITLSSKGLIEDIRKLLDTCGIYSYVNYKKSKIQKKEYDSWVLIIPNEYLCKIYDDCYCYDKQEILKEICLCQKDKSYCNNTNYPKDILVNKKEFRKVVHKQWNRNKTFKREIVENFNKQTGFLEDIVYKDFVWEQIKSVEFIDEETDMIDIEVEGTHNFIANHLVSHNSYSNTIAISWLLGVDADNDVLVVLGNPALVLTNTKGLVDMMVSPRFAKVFPKYQVYHDMDGEVRNNMFSVCRQKEGELTIAHSNKAMNVKIISKDTPVDGIRVRFLFLDDVCRSKDAGNNKMHEIDISNYWNSWWKRNYNTDDFYVIVGGTAYSIYDILSTLKIYYSKGKVQRSPVNKYTTLSLDATCVFICVPALDPDTDESTYPQKFPTEEKRAMRDRNFRDFMAMEQQQPLPPETSPFYWEKLQTYDVIPTEGRSDSCWATIDPVRVGGDNFAMPIFVKVGDFHYLKDCIYQNVEQEKIYQLIVDKIKQHHITQLVIERNTDTSLKKLLEGMLDEQKVRFCNIQEIYTYQKKEERITNQQNNIKTQLMFPAQHLYAHSSEMGKFMYDIVSFSWDMSKNQHDDSIDAVTMFCETLLGGNKAQFGSVKTFRR